MQTHRHQADILIIGGGVCGLNAALTAREQGRSVIVMDKAVIERSGHIAGGIDHFLAYMDTGAEWDTREAYLEFTGKSARGVTNIDVVDSVYCQELPHALKRFEEINCTLRQPDGTYYRTKSYGQPGPWWINFNGKRMKPLLAKAPAMPGAPCSTEWSPPICSPTAAPSAARRASTSARAISISSAPGRSSSPRAAPTASTATLPA